VPNAWVDQPALKERLANFFGQSKKDVALFGQTVNQTFEAFVFAATVAWYNDHQWNVQFVHPPKPGAATATPKLKFSTRGRPGNYSYAVCTKDGKERHVRHQLRVATRYHKSGQKKPANVCLDVAVIEPLDVSGFSTDDYVPNSQLVSFGEAKHMSAFAELVANFVGLVHELQPERLKRIRTKAFLAMARQDPAPFLYVSGMLYRTAMGIVETIERRKYDVDVFNKTKALSGSMNLQGLT